MDPSTLLKVIETGLQFAVDALGKGRTDPILNAVEDALGTLLEAAQGKTSPEVTASMLLQLEADLVAHEKADDAAADKALASKFDTSEPK